MSSNATNNTRQAAWVGIGSLFSFGFAIVSSMILSRYFDKGDYGTYKQVMYVYNTLLTIFTLGLPKAFSYFLPRVEESKARNLISKITKIFFALGLVFSAFLFFCAQPIADFLRNPDLVIAIKVFSPVPLLMLPTMGLESILSTFRKNIFNALYTGISRLLMLVGVCVPVIIFKGNYVSALVGFTIASFFTFLVAMYLMYLPVRGKGKEKCEVSYREIFNFSLPLLTASLWGILLTSADQFFISRYFGNDIFAEFSNGSMELPFVGMITGTCATVLSPIISKLAHTQIDPQKELYPLWINVFEKSAKLVYPLVIYCMFFSDVVMSILYGRQYECSSTYFIIKSFYSFFAVIIYAPLVINIGKVKFYSNTHMIAAISIVVLEYLSVKLIASPYAISVISLLVQLGKSFALLYIVARYFKVKIQELFPFKTLLLILLPSAIFLYFEHYIFMNILQWSLIVTLFVSFMIYVSVYFAYSLFVKLDYISIIKPLIHKK